MGALVGQSGTWHLLLEVVCLLGVALVFGGLLVRLRQSPLPGYLLAGMLLGGPGGLHVVHNASDIESIAELGVALLLFGLGLEFSWRRLKALGEKSIRAGAVQVAVTAAAAALACSLFHLPVRESIAIGAMFSLSSTAAVVRVLSDTGEIESLYGRSALAVLLVQDMAVVPLVVLVAVLSGGSGASIALDLGKTLLYGVTFVVGLYLFLDKVVVRALGRLSLERNRELTVLLAIVVGLGSTWAAHAAGLSPALGAFLSGMILGGSPFANQIRADVSSLRVVLLTLFFGAAGMVADPVWMLHHAALVVAVTAAVVVGKTLLAAGVLHWTGRPPGSALSTGLCLANVGEFAFVLGSTARSSGVLSHERYTAVVSVVIVTLFLTPWFVSFAPRLGAWVERRRRGGDWRTGRDSSAPGPEVVVIGFGPAGRAVGRELAPLGRRVLVLDLNPVARRDAEAMGLTGRIGDAQQMEILKDAGIGQARLVVITLPARSAAFAVLRNVRVLSPRARIVIRSRYELHAPEFRERGAHVVVGDEQEVGLRLAGAAAAELARTAEPNAPEPPPGSQRL